MTAFVSCSTLGCKQRPTKSINDHIKFGINPMTRQFKVPPENNKKLPMFTVPVFCRWGGRRWQMDGEGDQQVQIERCFRLPLRARNLREKHEWSSAFASRLCESVSDNPSLGYLSTELEEVDYCCNVWDKIKDCLSSSDLTMEGPSLSGLVFLHWSVKQSTTFSCFTRRLRNRFSALRIRHLRLSRMTFLSKPSWLRP